MLKLNCFLFFIFSALLGLPVIIMAQAVQTKEANYRDPVLDRQFGIIAEVKARPEAPEGTHYLTPEWNIGNIYMKSGDTLRGYPLMYNIDERLIEIQAKEVIKILPSDKVVAFEWQNKLGQLATFINGEYYTLDGTSILGFMEVLAAGKMQLLSRTLLEVKKADYNAALDVGSKSDKILKKEKLYLAKDKQLIELKEKSAFDVFDDKAPAMKAYAKEHKLKMSKKEDAAKLLTYYNSL